MLWRSVSFTVWTESMIQHMMSRLIPWLALLDPLDVFTFIIASAFSKLSSSVRWQWHLPLSFLNRSKQRLKRFSLKYRTRPIESFYRGLKLSFLCGQFSNFAEISWNAFIEWWCWVISFHFGNLFRCWFSCHFHIRQYSVVCFSLKHRQSYIWPEIPLKLQSAFPPPSYCPQLEFVDDKWPALP